MYWLLELTLTSTFTILGLWFGLAAIFWGLRIIGMLPDNPEQEGDTP
jgi:hypothetical protein